MCPIELRFGDPCLATLECPGLLRGHHDATDGHFQLFDLHLLLQCVPNVVLLVGSHTQDEPVEALAIHGHVDRRIERVLFTLGRNRRGGFGNRLDHRFSRRGFGHRLLSRRASSTVASAATSSVGCWL